MRRRVALAVAFLVVFAVGVAVGEALHDNPRPGGEQVRIRTLLPQPLAPAARETVTVTATAP